MLPARDRWRILGTTLLSLVLATHLAAATWTVYQGDTFELDDANASIEWGQNYTFNASGFTEYSDTLYLNMTGSVQDRNITLSSNTSAEFNTTLWQYNLSGVSDGKTMIKIQGNATGGTNVTFQFTALPRITYGHYVLSGGQSQTYGYGHDGTVTWHNTDWSADNFTVKYENDTARPSTSLSLSETAVAEGTDVTISCSASDPAGIKSSSLTITGPNNEKTYHPGCDNAFTETDDAGDYTVTFSATDQAGNTNTQSTTLTVSATGSTGPTPPPSAGHSWLLANNSTLFKWEKPLPEAGIQYVAVRTVEPRRTLSLDLRQLRDQPNGTATVQNPYRFYEFTKEQIANTEIARVNITVQVNRSFAQRFDRVVVSRYDNGTWTDLPTTPVDTDDEVWTYRATTPGFSYYVVRGQSTTTTPLQNQTETDESEQANGTAGPVCGNQHCEPGETRTSCPTDCGHPRNQTPPPGNETGPATEKEPETGGVPWTTVVGGIFLLLLISLGGYIGYRRWRHHNVQHRLQTLAEQAATQHLSEMRQHRVNRELDAVEHALEHNQYREVQERLDRIETLLSRQR